MARTERVLALVSFLVLLITALQMSLPRVFLTHDEHRAPYIIDGSFAGSPNESLMEPNKLYSVDNKRIYTLRHGQATQVGDLTGRFAVMRSSGEVWHTTGPIVNATHTDLQGVGSPPTVTVSGTVSATHLAGAVTQASQPNITELGPQSADLDANNFALVSSGTSTDRPVNAQDGVNKFYLDNYVQGIRSVSTVHTATHTVLPGVVTMDVALGTLTGTTALGDVGGVSVGGGRHILVKDQADNKENGIYRVTTSTSPFVLTRVASTQTVADAFRVLGGTHASTLWSLSPLESALAAPPVVSMGVDPADFVQIAGTCQGLCRYASFLFPATGTAVTASPSLFQEYNQGGCFSLSASNQITVLVPGFYLASLSVGLRTTVVTDETYDTRLGLTLGGSVVGTWYAAHHVKDANATEQDFLVMVRTGPLRLAAGDTLTTFFTESSVVPLEFADSQSSLVLIKLQ